MESRYLWLLLTHDQFEALRKGEEVQPDEYSRSFGMRVDPSNTDGPDYPSPLTEFGAAYHLKDYVFIAVEVTSTVMKNLQPQTGPGRIFFFHFFIVLVIILFIIFFFIYLFIHFFLSFYFSFFYHFIFHFFIILFFIFWSFFYHFIFHFFIIFFKSFFKHFFFQWCKKKSKKWKIAIFLEFFFIFLSFFIIFHHFSSIPPTTGSKNDKKMKKMKKNEKNWGKIAIFHFLENCNFPRVCFSFFFHFFSFFFHFFIIFHHFSSFFINSTTGSKNDKKMIKKW